MIEISKVIDVHFHLQLRHVNTNVWYGHVSACHMDVLRELDILDVFQDGICFIPSGSPGAFAENIFLLHSRFWAHRARTLESFSSEIYSWLSAHMNGMKITKVFY